MTSPIPIPPEELRELAALDAFGLLDEYETALFTRSYHHAPAALQNEIMALQAALVSDDSILPDVTPRAELRAIVLQAVSRAIEASDVQLAPLATIGRSRPAPAAASASSSRWFFAGPGQLWRAAAFVLIGAVVVLAYFWNEVYRQNNMFTMWALDNDTDKLIEALGDDLGPNFEQYLRDGRSERITLAAIDQTVPADDDWANLWLLADDDQALLIVNGLPMGDTEYTLTVRDSAGRTETVKQFRHDRHRVTHRISVSAFARAGSTWEISGPTGVLMRSI